MLKKVVKRCIKSITAMALIVALVSGNSSVYAMNETEERVSVYATARLNVRTGPGTKYKIYRVLEKDEQVIKLGEEDGWYRILVDGGIYYASGKYLEVSDFEMVYATANVNIRKGPGTNYDVVRVLAHHEKIKRVSDDGTWSQVKIGDEIYYISSRYLRPVMEPNGYLIVIDPGHQAEGDSTMELNGPGTTIEKARVTSGTVGTVTKVWEYELNLTVSMILKKELEYRGYTVFMTRTTNDVNMSNMERALFANSMDANAVIRIHANSSSNSTMQGALTICQTADSPYNAYIYEECYSLSKNIIDALVKETGAKDKGVWETNTMTGINWSTVPVTIVEMGYMSNKTEDKLLSTKNYQYDIVNGIANGLDAYMGR